MLRDKESINRPQQPCRSKEILCECSLMGPHNSAPRPASTEAGISIQDSSSDFPIRPLGCEKQDVRLIFVRAGSTEASPLHIVQGQRDLELSDKGIGQAYLINDYLRCDNIDACFTSDLARATATVDIILEGHSSRPPVIVDKRLRERDLGRWEGRLTEARPVSSRVTNNQETNDALLKRCTSFWHMLFPANGPIDLASHIDGLAEAEGRNQDYLTILVSSHAGPLSCIFKFLLENCSPDEHIDTHHPVITWHQDALREAQEADFWMKHGSVSEIVLTGEMKKDNAGNGASASPQGHWTWRGSVTTFGTSTKQCADIIAVSCDAKANVKSCEVIT